jgi:hypothetical protein
MLATGSVIYLKEHEDHVAISTSQTVFVKSDIGEIKVTVCDACGYEDVKCLHIKNHLDTSIPLITCLLCGL